MKCKEFQEVGATLLDLIVGILIMGILILIVVLNLETIDDSYRRRQAKLELEYDLRRAQSAAIREGGRAILTLNSGGTGYTFGVDKVPYSGSGIPDSTLFSRTISNGVTVSSSETLIFDPRGFVVDLNGDYNSLNLTCELDGVSYTVGTVYSTGMMEFS